MKKSSALLTAWIVLIALLAAAIVFFVLKGQSVPKPVTDEPVVSRTPDKPKPIKDPKPRGSPGHDTQRPPPSQKPVEVSGKVRTAAGEPVGAAKISAFAPTKAGLPDTPANPDEQRVVNNVICIPVDDFDLVRPLSTWNGTTPDESQDAGAPLATTDSRDDGSFTLVFPQGSGPGPWRLSAVKEGVGSATAAEVRAGANLDLTIGVAAAVSGVVITEVDSLPVSGARVTFEGAQSRFTAATGADGKFKVEGVTPGFYELSIAARGHTPLFQKSFKVGASDLAPYTLRMPRGTTLRVKAVIESSDMLPGGRSAQPSGTPVPNAQIVAYCEDNYTYVLAKTNAEGVAEFPGMPGGLWIVNGMAKGFVPSGEETVTVDPNRIVQDESISFEVAVESTLEVVDDDGRPVPGVRFYSLNNDDMYDAQRSLEVGTTDAQGKIKFAFEFEGPRAALFGFKEGFALVHAEPENYDEAETLRLVAKKAVKLSGRIHTPDGTPIADAAVTLTITPVDPNAFMDHELVLRSDKDGRYQFPYLPRSEGISISATAPDGISEDDKDLELVAGKDDYTVDLEIDLDETPPAPIVVRKPPVVPPQPKPRKDDEIKDEVKDPPK